VDPRAGPCQAAGMPETTPTVRTVGPDDLDDVCDLLAESDRAAVGFVDFTPEEVAADLASPRIEASGWYDATGTLLGYGWVRRSEGSNQVDVDFYVRPSQDDALGHEMLAALERRARELVREAGHDEAWLGVGAYRQDARTQGWLHAAGFHVDTTFTRMRIDLDPATAPDLPPSEVVVRRVIERADLAVAHTIEEESFVEHYGNVPISLERWLERLTDRGDDWVQVYLAELDGTPVGLLVSTRQFESDENAGYVRTLGVLPAGRGRGVGTTLLRDAFARAHSEGRAAVILHVDVANVTGALRLYESVGMRVVLEIDAWSKGERAPVGADAPA
jgi:mycothiol synthase